MHALQPTIHTLHISQAFAGLVIVAIAGNAVENASAIVLAAKGQSELAISVVKNSVAQIAAFLYPALVLVSLLTATTLTFALAPVYIGALFGTAVIVWQVTGDGEATAFEGAALDRHLRDPRHRRGVRVARRRRVTASGILVRCPSDRNHLASRAYHGRLRPRAVLKLTLT